MTEYNALQEMLIQSERLAAIGEAMTGLAHESRNALQRSQASLDLLGDQLKGRPESLELLESIQRSQEDLHRLYEEVRAFAAPIQIRPRVHDIGDVVRQAWDDVVAVRNARDVHVTEHHECDDLHCEVDAFSMGQVFRNIFEDAFQACRDPVQVHIGYADVSHQGSPAVSIAIRDNGAGLRREHVEQVFASFFTTKANGTGLGMAIALRVIEAHRGQIAVNPDCERGGEFVVTLARKQ
jgi:signal transduction histidine kinase